MHAALSTASLAAAARCAPAALASRGFLRRLHAQAPPRLSLLCRAPAVAARRATAAALHPLHPLRRWASAAAAGDAAAAAAAAAAARNRRMVGIWIATTAGAVFAMVVLGGVTRLTRSGLSIVEWRPAGEKLPTTPAEWEVEFDKYKGTPEFQRVNRHMSLDEFKPIYIMEWAHRQWGRGLGLLFGVPLAALALAGRIPPGLGPRLGLLLALGGAQGGIGWWMVKSGLEHERFDEHAIPRVSPYRLATHLGFAFTLYSVLTWTALDLLRAPPAGLTAAAQAAAARLRTPAHAAAGIIALTAASGAFVAGNDAGHAYNDWPLFAGRVIPEQLWESSLGVRNFFENTATVQFDHRGLAYASLGAVGAVHLTAARGVGGAAALPPAVRSASRLLAGLVGGQALLGVATLMLYVPVPLGALHQAGALALLTGALNLLHAIKQSARVAATTGVVAAPAGGSGAAGGAFRPAAAAAAVAAACALWRPAAPTKDDDC